MAIIRIQNWKDVLPITDYSAALLCSIIEVGRAPTVWTRLVTAVAGDACDGLLLFCHRQQQRAPNREDSAHAHEVTRANLLISLVTHRRTPPSIAIPCSHLFMSLRNRISRVVRKLLRKRCSQRSVRFPLLLKRLATIA